MKHILSLPAVIIASLLCLLSLTASAQAPASSASSTVVRVKGLDSATRDALSSDLARTAGPKLVYACVPAGILVFEEQGRPQEQVRSRSLSALEQHVRTKDITVLPMDRTTAEQQCAQARSAR